MTSQFRFVMTALLAAMCVVLSAQGARAVEGGPEKGAKSISIGGSLQEDNGFAYGQFGYFVTDSTEIVTTGSLSIGNDGLGGTTTTGMVGLSAKFHWMKRAKSVNYSSVSYLTPIGDSSARGGSVGITNGIDFFMKPQQSFYLEWQQLFSSASDGKAENSFIFGLRYFIP